MRDSLKDMDPIPHCISAARSCINAAELVRELVPPSHHLAFCVHYLTLSGITLYATQSKTSSLKMSLFGVGRKANETFWTDCECKNNLPRRWKMMSTSV